MNRVANAAGTVRGWSGRHPGVAAVSLLGLVACVWLWPLFAGRQLGQGFTLWSSLPWAGTGVPGGLPARSLFPDVALEFQPWTEVAREQARAGHLPLWNPYEYGGMTLAGNMQSAVFFPLTWIAYVLPVPTAWGLIALGKLLVAGVSTYALARELRTARGGAVLAGVVYMLAAPAMLFLQWPFGTVLCLYPLLLLATTRLARAGSAPAVAGVAAAFALLILAGHPEGALLAVSAAGLYLAVLLALDRTSIPGVRTALGRAGLWLAALLLGTAIAAVVVVPFVQAFWPSITRLEHGSEFAGEGLPWWTLLQYVVPGILGDAEPAIYGIGFGEFGVPALVLALVGLVLLRRRPETLAVAATALAALMAVFHVPPVIWLLEYVPPWEFSAARERAYFVIALAGALGAGAALSVLSRRPLAPARVALAVGTVGALAAIGFTGAHLAGDLAAPASVERTGIVLCALFLAITSALLTAAGRLSASLTALLAVVVAAGSLVDLQNLNVFLSPERAHPTTPPAIQVLQRQTEPFRVAFLREIDAPAVMLPNTSSTYGLESLEGYDFPLAERWSRFETSVLGFKGPNAERRVAAGPPTPAALTAMRMMNTRFHLGPPAAQPPAPGLRTIYDGPDGRVFEDPRALPRAYVAPGVRPVSDERSLALLAAGDHDPRAEALVPTGTPEPSPGTGFAPAEVERPAPDHVRVRVPEGASGWLVLAAAHHPNWTAEVDGRRIEPRPTNYAAMGVPLAEGDRVVDFHLDRTGFYIGLVFSLAALGLTLLLAVWPHLLSRRRRSPC